MAVANFVTYNRPFHQLSLLSLSANFFVQGLPAQGLLNNWPLRAVKNMRNHCA
jgi:hypothetical protein